jgi:hypothetical protein
MGNWKVVKSDTLSGGYSQRYIIIDSESGEMLDDAQGYGYKTAQNAVVAFKWKHDKKAQAWSKRKKRIAAWLEKNPEFDDELADMMFQAYKMAGYEDAKLSVEDIKWLLDKHGVTKFGAEEILRYLNSI